MPKVTFYNLKKEKKQKLIEAAQGEFSAVPFYDVSIANIVKNAGIPRGSFYQYFEDKEDLYIFLLNGLAQKRRDEFAAILKRNNGEMFDSITEFYISVLKMPDMSGFTKNIFLNMTDKTELALAQVLEEGENGESFEQLKSLIDRSALNIQNENEFNHLLKILFAVTMRNWIGKFAKDLALEEAVAQYKIELELLKKGLAK
ncbi:TetR family transcriptional regulator [Planomicrobium sp. Y74]|uniref:TetR/AcrR family transcriptional regulator n=1 Tax=Planomicrobium sp. Y74 TaxID=2478977 RepID=UPI000EF4A67E|nr:TetR family transcriptional regulator [Planomicrobium sp. Y74]RLQ92776.1 TetR/AcrR family transcriptional regulator [Planomicrobium sp. Y74]